MSKFNAGNYVVCRFLGESGDVIAGRVIHVKSGNVHIRNLLTNRVSIRKLSIVTKRNIVVPRNKATAVRALFAKKGNKKAARRLAVSAAREVKAIQDANED